MRPVAFTRFLPHVAPNLVLTSAQLVLCLVSFDAIAVGALTVAQRAIAARLFGSLDDAPPPAVRGVSVWVKGARVGGTMLCAYRLLHLALTVAAPNLAPGEILCGLIVGPDLRLARQALRYALGAAEQCTDITIEGQNQDSFVVVRPDGRRVSIECLPATRGGSALRGRSLVGALLTECSFFRDENYIVNDVELYRAVLPRILPGGQVLIESTPFAEVGLLYDLHQANFGHPSTALVAECPTLLLRDDEHTAAFVGLERQRDAVNAAREFDVQFLSAGSGVFFDPKLVDDRVDEALSHPFAYDPLAGRASAADFGFVNDSSALTVLQVRGNSAWLAVAEEIRPTPGYPLRPSEVSKRFAATMQSYASRQLVTDGHYIESIREHVEPFGIRLVRGPEGQTGKLEAFLAARQLIADKRVRIPPLPRLIAQLKSVISRPTPGGGLSISIPRRKGMAHGDLASAFVLSCWAVKFAEARNAQARSTQAKADRIARFWRQEDPRIAIEKDAAALRELRARLHARNVELEGAKNWAAYLRSLGRPAETDEEIDRRFAQRR